VIPYGYNGQWGYYTDFETGLALCTHRYYDPHNGRWVTRDPIGYEGGVNLYGYVGGNPVVRNDSSGLLIGTLAVGAILAIATGAAANCVLNALNKADKIHETNDKLAHCYMACKTAGCLGGGLCQTYLVPQIMSNSLWEDDPNDVKVVFSPKTEPPELIG